MRIFPAHDCITFLLLYIESTKLCLLPGEEFAATTAWTVFWTSATATTVPLPIVHAF